LRSEATRYRGEWKEAHKELESELLCHDVAREHYAKEREVKRRLEEAIKRAKVAPGVAAPTAVWEEEHALNRLRAEIAATYTALAAAVARTTPTQDKEHNARRAAELRKLCADLKAENDALRVAADMLEAAVAAGNGDVLDGRESKLLAPIARLHDGRQVDLMGKVQMQEQEKSQLRERLRSSEMWQESHRVQRMSSSQR